ncbi:acylneuraminate cytidylyltransferase, partial [Micromonospora sp. M51]|nr:acylneuraminate cytidylyltransferase [Micromonospora sp. M51]
MGSSRLPGKVLRPLAGRSVLGRVVRAAQDSGVLADLVVATSTDTVDDAVADECARLDVPCHRGPVDDVLDRFVGALAAHPGDAVM